MIDLVLKNYNTIISNTSMLTLFVPVIMGLYMGRQT